MSLISVIVPAYNAATTIKETLDSVCRQTLSNIEIIVINDQSTDATLDCIAQLKDSRLKVFSYPHGGVSASRNRGIACAESEFIAFLDADDIWTEDKLECQVQALQHNPDAALAYSWTDYLDESGRFLRSGDHVSWNGDVYQHLLVRNFLDNGSNPLIRKEVLVSVGGFNESLSCGEDWELWVRLAARYPFVVVPRPQVLYRLSASSASANIAQMEAQGLKVIERVFAQVPESLQHLKTVRLSNFYQYLMFRALAETLTRPQARIAAHCLRHALHHDPYLIQKRTKLMVRVGLKIGVSLLVGPWGVQWMKLKRMKKMS